MEDVKFLQNKKVSIKVVDKYRSGFGPKSDGNTLYTGCKQVFQAPTNQYDRLIPLMNEEEQRWFEERMGLDKGSLSFNNKDKSYWKDFRVTLDKKGKTLDLANYEDNLAYRVLMATPAIAKNKDNINVLQHVFYMVSDEQENEDNEKIADRFSEASKLFTGISKSSAKMINVLRLLGRQVPEGASQKWLQGEIVKIIDQKAKVAGVDSMDDFIRVAGDEDFSLKVFVMDAIQIGEVVVDGTVYKLRAGDTIGYDHSQAISYFKNPKNQQNKLLIEDRIANNRQVIK
jgi:hypothetical protein